MYDSKTSCWSTNQNCTVMSVNLLQCYPHWIVCNGMHDHFHIDTDLFLVTQLYSKQKHEHSKQISKHRVQRGKNHVENLHNGVKQCPTTLHQRTLTLTHLRLVAHIYMRQLTGSALVRVMACRLFGGKPLPEPMLAYCQLDSNEQTSVKFKSK